VAKLFADLPDIRMPQPETVPKEANGQPFVIKLGNTRACVSLVNSIHLEWNADSAKKFSKRGNSCPKRPKRMLAALPVGLARIGPQDRQSILVCAILI
jgi:hypothetical protein